MKLTSLLTSTLLAGTAHACIEYYVAVTYEVFTGWSVLANVVDNGVYICSGSAHGIGNNNWQGNCIPGFSVFFYGVDHEDFDMELHTPVNVWRFDMFDSCAYHADIGEYDAFCSGDDGSC